VGERPLSDGPDAPSRPPMTFRRLVGLDRSGPPPPQTLPGAPLNPWTVPNAIGFVRLALIPVLLVVGLGSEDGTGTLPAALFFVLAWGDYVDGIVARATGQYSRLGALIDPVADRLTVIAGVVVCWKFETLPRWAIAVLVARELYLLVGGRIALSRGITLSINWWGRLGVWPTMAAIFLALAGAGDVAPVLLYVGMAMALVAAALYTRDALAAARGGPSS